MENIITVQIGNHEGALLHIDLNKVDKETAERLIEEMKPENFAKWEANAR